MACLKTSRHDDNEKDTGHDCLTDHLCHSRCFFEEAHTTGTLPECSKFAGHEGKHVCVQGHACDHYRCYTRSNGVITGLSSTFSALMAFKIAPPAFEEI